MDEGEKRVSATVSCVTGRESAGPERSIRSRPLPLLSLSRGEKNSRDVVVHSDEGAVRSSNGPVRVAAMCGRGRDERMREGRKGRVTLSGR